MKFNDFFKEHKPEYTVFVYPNSKPVCLRSGFIRTQYLEGCASVAVLNGEDRIGAVSHLESIWVNDYLDEFKNLTLRFPELLNAQDLALLWNELNPFNRYNPNGDVYKLCSGLQNVFKKAELTDIPYKGCLDGYGLYVDAGILVLP